MLPVRLGFVDFTAMVGAAVVQKVSPSQVAFQFRSPGPYFGFAMRIALALALAFFDQAFLCGAASHSHVC